MEADFKPGTAFDVVAPAEQRVPFVFSSAHSGRIYPARFLALTQLDPWQIRRSEDCLVDDLYMGVRSLGAPLVRAHFPRAYVDANREPFELDPAMYARPLPPQVNAGSPRVAAGLGTIPRIVGEGRPIYASRLQPEDALMRIESCYLPYHRALTALIEATRAKFGFCVVIDCHSMPGQITNPEDGTQPHFILGDRFGQSAAPGFIGAARALLQQAGFSVSHNRPYAGGYITEHYGNPVGGVHVVQLEISRRLYLDESRYLPTSGFGAVQAELMRFCDRLMSLPDALYSAQPQQLAAE
ncbi:MAG: N-formylglutamate amidohydrolase [Rhizobiaceae bacterium]|nr:N-formylglutamate amidohydrolase [Rhizobiaceae bacterium]